MLDRVVGAWLHTRAVQAGGRLVIAIDGKTVRGANGKNGKAPHLVAALAHGIGAVLGQVAVEEKSSEIPAVRELLKAFASLAAAVITTGAMHTQSDTAQVNLGRGADDVMTVKGNVPTLYWVRDVTYQEDKSLVRTGNAPRVMASLRSLAISLPRLDGQTNIAAANRHHARDPQRTLQLLQTA